MTNDEIAEQLDGEVRALHDFIAGWFRGDVARDANLFEAAFSARLALAFVNIQPSGAILSRDSLIGAIRSGHGRNPDFRIVIEDCTLRQVTGKCAIVTYTERQFGARNTSPADNARVSTVVFLLDDGDEQLDERRFARATWLHIHETAVPRS